MTPDQYRREGAEAMREAIALGFVGHVRENVRRTPLPTNITDLAPTPDAVARLVEAAMHLLSEYDAPNPVDDAVSKLRTALVACKEARDD